MGCFPTPRERFVMLHKKLDGLEAKLNQIITGQQDEKAHRNTVLRALSFIQQQERTIMHTLDEVAADVAAETTSIDSLSAMLTGIKKQLDDALSGTTLPPAVQTKVDAIFDAAEINKQKLADALAANVPPAPPAPPVTPDVPPVTPDVPPVPPTA